MDITDADRQAYIRKQDFRFPVAHLDKKMHEDYGSFSVYPTLFLVDTRGIIRKHYIGMVSPEVIEADVKNLIRLPG